LKFKIQAGGESAVYPPKNSGLCHNCGKLASNQVGLIQQKHPFRGALRVGFGYTAVEQFVLVMMLLMQLALVTLLLKQLVLVMRA
jgi:hypothetical protein